MLVNNIANLLEKLNTMGDIKIQGIKAHSNIHGNEMADRAAKLGHKKCTFKLEGNDQLSSKRL